MTAQRRFPVILRSRKPISDEVVYVSSIPYRPLTEWKEYLDGKACEAVDPWGNQVLLTKKSDYAFISEMLDKDVLHKLKIFHPEFVSEIETDGLGVYYVGDTFVTKRNPRVDGSLPVFIKVEYWVPKRNGYTLLDTEGHFMPKNDLYIGPGPVEELIDDHFKGEIRYHKDRVHEIICAHAIAKCIDNTPMEYFFERVWSDPARVYPVFDSEGMWTQTRPGEYEADGGWHVRKDRRGYALRDPDGGWRSFPSLRKAGEYVGLWKDPNRRGRRR